MAKNMLRFPVLKDVEYLDIIKNSTTVKTFNKKDVEGITWRELQKKIGAIVPGGMVNFALKFNQSNEIHKGTIRAVNDLNPVNSNDDKNLHLLNELDVLKKQISSIGAGSGVSIDLLLSISKQSYETQISFLNAELIRKENYIDKLQKKIDELESDLDNASDLIEDLKSKTGMTQYLDIAKTFLSSKIGAGAQKIATLKDSNQDDIPESILNLLGAVDWVKVPQDVLNTIVQYLELYINKLPLKGA